MSSTAYPSCHLSGITRVNSLRYSGFVVRKSLVAKGSSRKVSKSAGTKSIAELKDFKSVLGPVSYSGDREIVLPLFVKTFGPDGRNVLVDDKLWLMP